MPYTPNGIFLHVPPPEPVTDWRNDFGTPWWRDEQYCIGNLSACTRKIQVVNTLNQQSTNLEVCSEETLGEILDRYLDYNAHAGSYTWKVRIYSLFFLFYFNNLCCRLLTKANLGH